ncbi:MAG: GAF domain-containing protein [Candidatus Woesearchaeota archaeon]|nr:GAF domain-containing protein [Candidatus Woesearchaeota archaeon]
MKRDTIDYETLRILFETNKLLNKCNTIESILSAIKIIAVKKLKYDYFSFFLHENRKFMLKESFKHPFSSDKLYHIKTDQGITGHAAKTGIPQVVQDVSKDKRYIQIRKDVKSELVVPVKIDGKVVGLINVESRKIGFFSHRDMFLMNSIAEQAAITLKKVMDKELIENSNKRLRNLNDIGKVVNSTLDLDIIFRYILDYIYKEMNYDFIAILLLDKDKLYSKAGIGFTKKQLESYSAKVGQGICGMVVKTGKPLLINDVSKVPFYINQASKTKAELSVPIRFKEKIIGVLNVESGLVNAFNNEDLVYLSALADQVASAIKNAQLYEKIKNFNKTLKKEVADATKELVEANIELKRLNEIKSEFVSTVSHELRTPLTSIIGYVSVIKDGEAGEISETQKEFLGIVKEESERLLRLISDLLDISKIDSGKMRFNFTETDASLIAQNSAKEMESLFAKKGITLDLELDRNVAAIKADPDKIKQILYNLLTNALKFSKPGTTVKVISKDKGNHVQFDITDQGIGISKEDIPKLFKKFSQIDSKMTREVGGTGLGLAICEYLVKQHGGNIWVKSESGKGSTFSFTIKK